MTDWDKAYLMRKPTETEAMRPEPTDDTLEWIALWCGRLIGFAVVAASCLVLWGVS